MSFLSDGRRVRAGETIQPSFQRTVFHCPWCAVYAPQDWEELKTVSRVGGGVSPMGVWMTTCDNCDSSTYWLEGNPKGNVPHRMLYPLRGNAPVPHPELPEDVRADYDEAAAVVAQSPRSAAALLRLSLQKLMPHLDLPGKNLNADIGALVKKGLEERVQKALDSLRVVGNNAVHPGELDLRDDAETAGALFEILNYIVEQQVALPKRLDAMYEKLPEVTREAIENRDASAKPAADTG